MDLPFLNLKKKAFFYFNYDQTINHTSYGTYNTIPTQQVMSGDFTNQPLIYDPTTQVMANDSAGNPYPIRQSFQSEYGSNAIPASMWDSVAAKFQKFYPTPGNTIPGSRFVPGTINSVGIAAEQPVLDGEPVGAGAEVLWAVRL